MVATSQRAQRQGPTCSDGVERLPVPSGEAVCPERSLECVLDETVEMLEPVANRPVHMCSRLKKTLAAMSLLRLSGSSMRSRRPSTLFGANCWGSRVAERTNSLRVCALKLLTIFEVPEHGGELLSGVLPQ
jgi:hypothetical protein